MFYRDSAKDFRLKIRELTETPEDREERERQEAREMEERTDQRLYRELRKMGCTDEEITAGRERLRAVMAACRKG